MYCLPLPPSRPETNGLGGFNHSENHHPPHSLPPRERVFLGGRCSDGSNSSSHCRHTFGREFVGPPTSPRRNQGVPNYRNSDGAGLNKEPGGCAQSAIALATARPEFTRDSIISPFFPGYAAVDLFPVRLTHRAAPASECGQFTYRFSPSQF